MERFASARSSALGSSLRTLSVVIACHASTAVACGPFLPNSFLSDRAAQLQTAVSPDLVTLLARDVVALPAAPNQTAALQSSWDYNQDRQVSALEQYSLQSLSPQQWQLVQQMRQQSSTEQALNLGQSLPAIVRDYTVAAVAMATNSPTTEASWRQFIDHYDQQAYVSFARYSLGRWLVQQQRFDDAIQTFEQLRLHVSQGAEDPLGLAMASLGEQARIYYQQGDVSKAIGYYAAQAQYGGNAAVAGSGEASLRQVARDLLKLSDTALAQQLEQPAVMRLLTAYLLGSPAYVEDIAMDSDSRVLQLLQQHGQIPDDVALSAALFAYGEADFANAQHWLAQTEESPLQQWLTAKLALQRGDMAAATTAYAKILQVAQSTPTATTSQQPSAADQKPSAAALAPGQLCRINAESGVLHLQRGDYLQALQLLLDAGADYWHDAAYVAERVLTISELKALVDERTQDGIASDDTATLTNEQHLRQLLARRLMRDGQTELAIGYFVAPSLRQAATQYAQLQQSAAATTLMQWGQRLQVDVGQIDAAQARFALAQLTRAQGMELFGYELAPDFYIYGGSYEFDQSQQDAQARFTTPASELQRLQAHTATNEHRFHYRNRAASWAAESAELVPHNSQAYAASMCQATTWLIHTDWPTAQGYYQRYLTEGPYVAWGADFGIRCPAPDFVAAGQRLQYNLRQSLPSRHQLAAGFGATMVLLGGAWWFKRRRRLQPQAKV